MQQRFSKFAVMNIYTASEMKRLEALAMDYGGLRPMDLMERAANELFNEIRCIKDVNTPVKVFAGPHNNGGDALAVSRLLSKEGYDVEVFLFNTSGHMSEECATQRDLLITTCTEVAFHEIQAKFDLPPLSQNDLVIDGLFGIGLNAPLPGGYALLVKYINASQATIVSIDIPSGMMCEDNTATFHSQIIRADYTLSLQGVKPAFLMRDCQPYLGKCKILDIGIESLGVPRLATLYTLSTPQQVKPLLKYRDPFGNKGTFGHGLLIAGSYGMAGAAVIAAQAAMKSGMGKLTVHTPSVNNTILQTSVPQAIIHNDEDSMAFTSPEVSADYQAVAIGPGLGTQAQTATAMMNQMSHSTTPLVIDADALNILEEPKGWLQQIPKNSILTPHPKEFERLFGATENDFQQLNKAREEARSLQIYLILKNHFTAICCPNGHIHFNTTGNSGMATAGTGDALTGILLSLLAQGYDPESACRLGCYLHGSAGDLAADKLTEEGMTVMDLVNEIPYAIKELKAQNIQSIL